MKQYLQILLLILILPLTGCLIVPVPAKDRVETGTRIRTNDLAFVQSGKTTREELESKIGKPWSYYDDLRASVYYWEIRNGYWVWGLVLPFGDDWITAGDANLMTRMEILCVAFDEQDRVRRFAILRHPDHRTTKKVVKSWLGTADAPAHAAATGVK